MGDHTDAWAETVSQAQARNAQSLEKILAAAQPGAVYAAPVVKDGYTIITASQIAAGGGYGFGMGTGTAPANPNQPEETPGGGSGGGGGGGGFSTGRPVAAIVIGPEGVRVEPIVDVTRLGIAGITTAIAMLATLRTLFKK
ncbi:MAG: hypothetical protein WCF84_13935 [Anaerolineae bacterium]